MNLFPGGTQLSLVDSMHFFGNTPRLPIRSVLFLPWTLVRCSAVECSDSGLSARVESASQKLWLQTRLHFVLLALACWNSIFRLFPVGLVEGNARILAETRR